MAIASAVLKPIPPGYRARNPIRVLGHDLNGIGTIGLIDPNSASRADPAAVQKDHDIMNNRLFRPGSGDAPGA